MHFLLETIQLCHLRLLHFLLSPQLFLVLHLELLYVALCLLLSLLRLLSHLLDGGSTEELLLSTVVEHGAAVGVQLSVHAVEDAVNVAVAVFLLGLEELVEVFEIAGLLRKEGCDGLRSA